MTDVWNLNFLPSFLLLFLSVTRTPPSVTMPSTWVCPAVKRTSTAVPASPPASSSSAAPRRPSGSPHSSHPPSWRRMVWGPTVCDCVVVDLSQSGRFLSNRQEGGTSYELGDKECRNSWQHFTYIYVLLIPQKVNSTLYVEDIQNKCHCCTAFPL